MPTAAATTSARSEPSEISTTRARRRFRRCGGVPSEDPPGFSSETSGWVPTFVSDVSDISLSPSLRAFLAVPGRSNPSGGLVPAMAVFGRNYPPGSLPGARLIPNFPVRLLGRYVIPTLHRVIGPRHEDKL